MAEHEAASKRNLTFNLLDPDQIRLTLCYTDYFALFFLIFLHFLINFYKTSALRSLIFNISRFL